MRKVKYLKILGLALALFGFSGCGTVGLIRGDILTKKGIPVGMDIKNSHTGKVKFPKTNFYKDKSNVYHKCSVDLVVHAAATKALENGYNYFSIVFKKGSNKSPLAINSVDKVEKYCTSNYYDKESDLLDAKCAHNGLGMGTPGAIGSVNVYFYKKRNPFIPLWDAKKALSDLGNDFIEVCWSGDMQAYRTTLGYYEEKFDFKEMDE